MSAAPEPRDVPACGLEGSGETARRLHVSVTWLLAEAASGRLPAVQIGQRFWFSPAAVREALFARQHGGIIPLDGAADTAKYLGITRDELIALAESGKIPAYRVGNRWAFQREVVGSVLMRLAGMGAGRSWLPPGQNPGSMCPVIQKPAPADAGGAA